jgi:hypothetical protein
MAEQMKSKTFLLTLLPSYQLPRIEIIPDNSGITAAHGAVNQRVAAVG